MNTISTCKELDLIYEILSTPNDKLSRYVEQAISLTNKTFGNKRTVFNPIYLSDVCMNDCVYCGYRRSNTKHKRRTLKPSEVVIEARVLAGRGIKHILVLAGEYSYEDYFEMLIQNIEAIVKEVHPTWLGIEVAPLNDEGYVQMASLGVNSVTLFQETYDVERYKFLHRKGGPKSNFEYRFNSLSRAIHAGISEVGLGVLYGVGNWYTDTLGMASHTIKLLKQNKELKLRFSFPRLNPSEFLEPDARTEWVTENMLLKAIVAIRLAFPKASLVLTGRESTEFLSRCIGIVNVIGKGGSTIVGGYKIYQDLNNLEQFQLNTDYSLEEFRKIIIKAGYTL